MRSRIVLGVALIAVMIVVGVLVGTGSTPLDDWFLALVTPLSTVGWLNRSLLLITAPALAGVALLVVAIVAFSRRAKGFALFALAYPPLAVVLASFVSKPLFGRYYTYYLAYPSGHTTLLITTLTVLVFAFVGVARRRMLLLACVLAPIGMLGLVSTHFHYLTDTLGAAAFALGLAALVSAIPAVNRGTAPPIAKSRADISFDTRPAASPR